MGVYQNVQKRKPQNKENSEWDKDEIKLESKTAFKKKDIRFFLKKRAKKKIRRQCCRSQELGLKKS